MLEIKGLTAQVEGKAILRGMDLRINPGEVHAIMGPNGSGKSTLSAVLAGQEGYTVTDGSITYEGHDLFAWSPEERALAGLFLAFQYPVEIPGVNNLYFLKTMVNRARKHRGEPELDAFDLISSVKDQLALIGLNDTFLKRSLNVGFSGGEKKRNEILQMLLLKPKLAILDEIDSGLDVDALKMIASAVSSMRSPTRSFILITHYQRLLNYVQPDFVHILMDGVIVRSGDASLALTVESQGYGCLLPSEVKS